MEKKRLNREKTIVLISLLCLTTAVALQLLARNWSGFAQWYAGFVYPVIVGVVGRLFGVVPFSVVEIGLYVLLAGSVFYVVCHFREVKRILVRLFCMISVLFLVFTLNCGINYYRKPFSDYMNLEPRKSSGEELEELCLGLTDRLNALREEEITAAMDQAEAKQAGVQAMRRLGETYPSMSGYYPQPKALLWSYLFSVQQLCGEYSPFTVEANYNGDMPDYNIPHTICHELSHLRGFMREDEANFIGYLACISSDSPSYQYSGYLTGWVYATNALAKINMEQYQVVCGKLDKRIWEDLRYNNEFWSSYDGKAAEVSNQLNDTYLKMNSQTDGVKSYGRMVDLMLAYAGTSVE